MSRLSPEEVLLGLIAPKGGYGYQLLAHFSSPAPLASIWAFSTSQLYSLLKRLENREEIEGREFFPADAPPRTEYWLTPLGDARLRDWLHHPVPSASTRHIRTAFISRLYIARRLGEATAAIISAQRASVEEAIEQVYHQRQTSTCDVQSLALDLRLAELQIILPWLDRAAKQNLCTHCQMSEACMSCQR